MGGEADYIADILFYAALDRPCMLSAGYCARNRHDPTLYNLQITFAIVQQKIEKFQIGNKLRSATATTDSGSELPPAMEKVREYFYDTYSFTSGRFPHTLHVPHHRSMSEGLHSLREK